MTSKRAGNSKLSTRESLNAAMTAEFHEAFRLPVVDLPDRVDVNMRVLREEVSELADAMADGDRVAATHELADVVYVAYEIAATYSLPLDAAFAEVHRANMSKLDDEGNPVFRADGKVLKGPNYRPPNVAGVVGLAKRPQRKASDQ